MPQNKCTLVIKTLHLDTCTIGRLSLSDTNFKCFTLELPWLGNAKNISCIPAGYYDFEVRRSPSLKMDVIHILGVPNRTWIYIHAGNFTRQIQGCMLVGNSIKDIDKDGTPDVTDSKEVFFELMDLIPATGRVHIKRGVAI